MNPQVTSGLSNRLSLLDHQLDHLKLELFTVTAAFSLDIVHTPHEQFTL